MLAHDSITSFLGALGDVSGAVVAAGTGVVALGVGRHSVARVDGWGNIMGDAGSGYWIGREALDAVMRAHDGRGGPTALTDVVRERWPDLESAYIELQAAADRVRLVASFAQPVAELAATDPIAADICRRAAGELATTATAALTGTAEPGDGDRAVCAIGGIFSRRSSATASPSCCTRMYPGPTSNSPRLGARRDGRTAIARTRARPAGACVGGARAGRHTKGADAAASAPFALGRSADAVDDPVQGLRRAHDRLDEPLVGPVVAADLGRRTLHREQFGHDPCSFDASRSATGAKTAASSGSACWAASSWVQ